MIGNNEDITRWTAYAADPDSLAATTGYSGSLLQWCFGSSHSNGFQMAFCDGSVQMIPYTMNSPVHRYLGSRADGHATDPKSF